MDGYAVEVTLAEWLLIHDRMLRLNFVAEYVEKTVTVRFQTRHGQKVCREALKPLRERRVQG